MRPKGRILLMCTALILRAAGASAQTDPASTPIKMDITLKEAIKIALSENPTIRVADKDIELKKTADKEAWQQLLPEANVSGSLTHTLLAAEMKLNGNTFKMGQDGTTTGNAAVSLSLPIFAPAVYKTMSMTKADIQLALEQSRASKLDLTNQVTKAFYQLLLAQDSYEVMKQSYAISEENFNVVNSKYAHGAVSEYDKISAEVQMRSMSSSLTSAQTALSLAQLQLKVLMGVTEDVTLNIKDRLENYEDELILADPETSKQELTNNSQLKQFDLNKTLLEKTRKVLQTSFMPTLSFSLNYQYQSLYNNSFNIFRYDWAPSSSFVFTLSIPIFKASNWTKLKSNRIQIMQLEDNRLNTERQLSMAVESYTNNMLASIKQVESNKEAVRQADKARLISSKRYDVGKGTILELNQSEVALTQAKLTYNQSIYDYLTNKADLDYTLGRETYNE